MKAIDVLIKYWGYSSFKTKQEEIISNVLENKDVLALLPTGAGKSVCYQVPALMKEGICLVISPLISLMNDQSRFLSTKGIKSIALTQNIHKQDLDNIFNTCKYGGIKFLFLSPERLQSKNIQNRLSQLNINLITVDEAHCISEWGHQFRPSYRNISNIRLIFPQLPILALTATATKNVVEDIINNLNFKKENIIIRSSFKRDNISYIVNKLHKKEPRLIQLINKIKSSVIIYASTRKKVEIISNYLKNKNYSTNYYHAGLPYEKRKEIQEKWTNNQIRIIVATNSFGMGINKLNVRLIIHMSLPPNIESYYQQSGRAGRDGKQAYSFILMNEEDINRQKKLINIKYPKASEIKDFYQNLANFLQIPIGTLPEEKLSLNIKEFNKRYETTTLQLYNMLNYLQEQEYVMFFGFIKPYSRLKFMLNTNDLYKFQIENKLYDPFIRLLLRSYPRLFQEFVIIDEKKIAQLTNKDVSYVKKIILKLEKLEILKYQYIDKNIIQLKLLQERKDAKYLRFNDRELENRKNNDEYRLNKMIEYSKVTNKCRNIILLEYFDELSQESCQKCDYCLKKKKNNTLDHDY